MRSRTPTGAEMKQQHSLDVPPQQVRSASFDEAHFKGRREDLSSSGGMRSGGPPADSSYEAGSSGVSVIGSQGTSLEVPGSASTSSSFLLRVPYLGPKRSRSFDSGCGDEDDPLDGKKNQHHRPVTYDRGQQCVHCNYLEQLNKRRASRLALQFSDKSTSREDEEFDWDNSSDDLNAVICGIKVTLSPNSPLSTSPPHPREMLVPPVVRARRSSSPKLERQPAIYCTDLSSQENSVDMSDGGYSHHGSIGYLGSSSEYGDAENSSGNVTGETFLNVPTKLDRAVSLDMSFSSSYPRSFTESEKLNQIAVSGMTRSISLQPPQTLRSKSIDIELPTHMNDDYKIHVTSPQSVR